MKLICEKCNEDATEGGTTNGMCGICYYEATGEGTVIDCQACGRLWYYHAFADEKRLSSRLCFMCFYWDDLFQNHADDPRCARIDGTHYTIVPDGDGMFVGPFQGLNALFQGFGGSEFTIQFFDNRGTVVTRNLWLQGEIPKHFRGLLPDNARFVSK